MTRKRRIHPDRILDAAEHLLTERGIYSLTLDMVAAEAGISKGGLTYTFASKEALLSALVDREVVRFCARLKPTQEKERALPYPELCRFLEICRSHSMRAETKVAAVLAAVQNAPASLKSTRAYFKWMLSKFSPDSEQGRCARLVFYAAQGLYLLQGFRLLTLTAAERRRTVEDFVSFLATQIS